MSGQPKARLKLVKLEQLLALHTHSIHFSVGDIDYDLDLEALRKKQSEDQDESEDLLTVEIDDIEGTSFLEEIDLLDGCINEIEDKIEETVATPEILFR